MKSKVMKKSISVTMEAICMFAAAECGKTGSDSNSGTASSGGQSK